MNIDMTVIEYLVDFFVAIVFYIIIYIKKYKKLNIKKKILNTLLFIYILLVLRVTLMPIIVRIPYMFNHPYIFMNLNAYGDIFSGIAGSKIETLLNIIMFIPFGFLLPIVKEKSILKVILYAFLFSLLIELLQPLINPYRASDITDLINNTIGGLIGYISYLILKPLLKKIKLI